MAFTVLPAALEVLDADEFTVGGEGAGAFVAARWVGYGFSASWAADSFATHAYALSVLVTCGAIGDEGGGPDIS